MVRVSFSFSILLTGSDSMWLFLLECNNKSPNNCVFNGMRLFSLHAHWHHHAKYIVYNTYLQYILVCGVGYTFCTYYTYHLHIKPFVRAAPQVTWIRHRDLHLLTVDKTTYTSDQRFVCVHNPQLGDWSLQVSVGIHYSYVKSACAVCAVCARICGYVAEPHSARVRCFLLH